MEEHQVSQLWLETVVTHAAPTDTVLAGIVTPAFEVKASLLDEFIDDIAFLGLHFDHEIVSGQSICWVFKSCDL